MMQRAELISCVTGSANSSTRNDGRPSLCILLLERQARRQIGWSVFGAEHL